MIEYVIFNTLLNKQLKLINITLIYNLSRNDLIMTLA